MKKEEFKKGVSDIKNIKLEEDERKAILNYVLNIPTKSPYADEVSRKSFWQILVTSRYADRILMAAFAVVLTGGLTVYAAESSLPGDTLYPVKVSFTESVRDLINANPENKAEWESIKAARRLDEAAHLIISGKLDERNRSELESRIYKHIDAFDDSLREISTATPESDLIEIEFEANMSAGTDILESLEKDDLEKSEEVKENLKADIPNKNATSSEEAKYNIKESEKDAGKNIEESETDNDRRDEVKKLKESVKEKLEKRKSDKSSRKESVESPKKK